MKEKESYTFEELCTSLKIPISKFCQMAGVTEGTITRLRKGYSARRGTINTLLDTFSQIYGIDFSLENVTGLTPIEKPITKTRTIPTSAALADEYDEADQSRTTERKKQPIPDDLPQGTIKLIDFKNKYGLSGSNMSHWISDGIKGEKIETITRPKPNGIGPQHYLTPAQQEKALEILKRHGKLKAPEAEQKQTEEPAWYLPD